MRVNIGCGMTPTDGWENFDNSFSLRLSRYHILPNFLYNLKLINLDQLNYINFCKNNRIKFADATKLIPLKDSSAEVVYSSHMLEHLDREEVILFLSEVKRVLISGGILRLALPDISIAVDQYIVNKDADEFISKTYMGALRPRTLAEKIRVLFVGTRHHHWMYDGKSLCKLLEKNGFSNAKILSAGETTILDPGKLDLYEYNGWSVYVEARNI